MASLGRASAILGAGTLVSRITGLVRTFVLILALGNIAASADAFSIANHFPNDIYAVISTGLLTGVILPQIVRAAADKDGGSAFVSKLLTLGTVVLVVITALAVIAAPAFVAVYGGKLAPDTYALTIAFAYWCMPQVLFYGLYALFGEVLNARKIFGPYTWAPIINNLISIAGFLTFLALFGPQRESVGWTPGMVAIMGGTATLGIIAQAAVLMMFWRRTGLHVRPDFHWRGMGLREIGRLASWTTLMVVVGIIAGITQTFFVGEASGLGASAGSMGYAWTVFILPYSVIAYSIGTPYFTQLAEHAARGRTDEVRRDLDTSIRTLGILLVAALAAIVAAIVPLSRILTDSTGDAYAFAWLLGGYLVGLVPLGVLFIIQRTFYAYHDTFRPFLFTLVQAGIAVATTIISFYFLPPELLAAGIAVGQSLGSFVQLTLAIVLLRRKLGPLELGRAGRAMIRFLVAAVPAIAVGWALYLLSGAGEGWMMMNVVSAVLATMLVGAVTLVVYVAALAALRTPELAVATGMVRRILGRGRS